MADDIRQFVSIEAAQAIKTLRDLDAGLRRFSQGLTSAGGAMKQFNAGSTRLEDNASGISAALQKTTRSFQGFDTDATVALRNIDKNTTRLTTSLGLLSRIVFTQAVIKGFREIEQGISRSVTASIEYQKQIGLAQTIAGGVGFDKLASSARDLSKNLGIDQSEVAAGLFQTLSNQVSPEFSKNLKFLETAGKFAKATGSSTSEAVDLLSGAIKSFNLQAEDTESVASKFFVALDKGRLTASELANTVGRVLPVAAELGISLDEVNSFLAASTITGTKASESITQLRGIMTSFIKPNDDMAAALKKLGFDSGQAAIKSLGLKGAVQSVTQAAGGNTEAIGKLFREVRGMTGVVSALRTQEAAYNETLKESITSIDLLDKKFQIVASTSAAKFEKSIERISTTFSEAFGDKFLKGAANALDKLSEIGDAINEAGIAGGGRRANLSPIRKQFDEFAALQKQQVNAAKLADIERLQSAKDLAAKLRGLGETDISAALPGFVQGNTAAGFQQQASNTKLLEQQATTFQKMAAEITKLQSFGLGDGPLKALTDQITALSSGQIDPSKLAAVVAAMGQLQQQLPDDNRVQQLRDAVQFLNEAAVAQAKLTNQPSLDLLQAATKQAGTNISGALGPATQLADQLERAAKASQQIGVGGGAVNKAMGGIIRGFAAGGFAPRGTDTIPAMLSPGEFVINAASSKRFFSELVAINSGKQPIYRESGGPVTINNNIGDVSFHGVENGEIAVRQFAARLSREQRKGGIR
jgi:TP901 family phage tail tape measure protein